MRNKITKRSVARQRRKSGMFQQRHYWLIAETILTMRNELGKASYDLVIKRMAETFVTDSDSFKPKLFYMACYDHPSTR